MAGRASGALRPGAKIEGLADGTGIVNDVLS
jgi:hypothetical protein